MLSELEQQQQRRTALRGARRTGAMVAAAKVGRLRQMVRDAEAARAPAERVQRFRRALSQAEAAAARATKDAADV